VFAAIEVIDSAVQASGTGCPVWLPVMPGTARSRPDRAHAERRRANCGVRLSCRAVPVTSIIIELQEGDRLRPVSLLGFNSGRH
jgi:hypothetical protein